MPSLKQIGETHEKVFAACAELKRRFPNLDERAKIEAKMDWVRVGWPEKPDTDPQLPAEIDGIPVRSFGPDGRELTWS
jgi:hypothetical protein